VERRSQPIFVLAHTHLADRDLLVALEGLTLLKSFDEEPCYKYGYETSYEDIDFAASQLFSSIKALKKRQDFISLGVLLKNNAPIFPTIRGLLLFVKERLQFFPNAYIQFGVFEG